MAIGGRGSGLKQLKMTEIFSKKPRDEELGDKVPDIEGEEISQKKKHVKFADEQARLSIPVVPVAVTVPNDPKLMVNDYSAWISSRKARWQHLRARLNDTTAAAAAAASGPLIWSKGRLKDALLTASWQLISIEEDAQERGYFRLFGLVGGAIRSLRFKQPRKIYLHCREEFSYSQEIGALPLVHFKLPYSDPESPGTSATSKVIYAIEVDEGDAVSNYQQYSAFLGNPNVLGVYEATLPLSFINLLSMGTKVAVEASIRSLRDPTNPSFVFAASDFVADFVAGGSESYLTGCRFLYVFHLHTDNRHVILAVPSGETVVGAAIVIDPAGRKQVPNLKTLYSAALTHQGAANGGPFKTEIVPEFEVDMVPDLMSGVRLLRRVIERVQGKNERGALIAVGSSSASGVLGAESIASALQLAFAFDPDRPIPFLQFAPGEEDSLPPLDWQRFGLRRGFEHFFSLNAQFDEIRELARFAQIPLGCLLSVSGAARSSFISDVFLGRALRSRGFLLPHGQDHQALTQQAESSAEVQLEVERSGVSEQVVCDVNIIGFALNSLLQVTNETIF
jgi:hypothetical protein